MKKKKFDQDRFEALWSKLEEFKEEILLENRKNKTVILCYLCTVDANALKKVINWGEHSNLSRYKVGSIPKLKTDTLRFVTMLCPEYNESRFNAIDDPGDEIKLAPVLYPDQNPIEKLRANAMDYYKDAYTDMLKLPGGKSNGETKESVQKNGDGLKQKPQL